MNITVCMQLFTVLQLINEPFAGAVLQHPDLLLPGVAGARNLQPLYNAAGAGIRTVNQKHTIFYEPVTWGMVEEGKYLTLTLSSHATFHR